MTEETYSQERLQVTLQAQHAIAVAEDAKKRAAIRQTVNQGWSVKSVILQMMQEACMRGEKVVIIDGERIDLQI